MNKHFIHPFSASKKRSTSLLPTADNLSQLSQQLEAAYLREAALQSTVATQAQTIKEQQAVIAALQARLQGLPEVTHQEIQADFNADFVKSIDKFQDEAVWDT